MAKQSITLCILATYLILTTNIFTSCDARLSKVLSWDPTEDLDYFTIGSSIAPSPLDPPSDSVKPPKSSATMVSDPPGYTAQPPSHGPHKVPPGPPSYAVWCVARPTVPESMLQKAMDYACGFGADCKEILPSGACFVPNSLLAHASYAFNSYWQRTKIVGGTCDFGGTAMLITVDPSYDRCHFAYN